MDSFKNIDYLATGNPTQKKAFAILNELDIFEKLKNYSPTLTGTVPIGINIENSDLDIICYCKNLNEFFTQIQNYYAHYTDFYVNEKTIRQHPTIVARFKYEGFIIELFGQNRPVDEQEAYRHMIIEWKILQQKGEEFRQQIIELKKQGLKTEPAFAKLLELHGDPYLELLKFGELLS